MDPPEPERWQPELHEPWFHITADGQIAREIWTDAPADRARWRVGNCFPTREQAEEARERIREVLQRLRQPPA